jgi:hypothetical protein
MNGGEGAEEDGEFDRARGVEPPVRAIAELLSGFEVMDADRERMSARAFLEFFEFVA